MNYYDFILPFCITEYIKTRVNYKSKPKDTANGNLITLIRNILESNHVLAVGF